MNVSTFMLVKVADLYGLILAGGRSKRMGEDKASINYHGKPQLDYLLEVMNECLKRVFISTRPNQSIHNDVNVIEDAFDVHGPLNGLLSAHRFSPDKAWLVIAVDMPLVNKSTIQKLVDNRDPNGLATAYQSASLPEPLAAIWESKGLEKIHQNFNSGEIVYPRRFLIENEVKVVTPMNHIELRNINTNSELRDVKSVIENNRGKLS